ncbi:translation factor SUA5 [Sinobacterium caligoides]|uniref:Threonylcarbamoyl-AMP synthase n=1 Tax=Sinobacterium caligoides TaxID=933926 RepID=A0A3N2DH88_9GAMM|nr:Sua5/YciO/YrdC/YwlC family protein [Sinobacterium caligoides]ROR98988.1 translation factor SUA5 [Sinobacterium caligoides]
MSEKIHKSPAANPWLRHVAVRRCVETISCGGVIAYPTEAVWGLGCDPENALAVEQLLALKGRSVDKGLIMVAANIEQLAPYLTDISAAQRQSLEASWPGPNTWLVADNGRVPAWIRGRHDSVALRVSSHPLVVALCQRFGGPIVSTSANPQGKPSARSALQVRRYFAGYLDGIAPGCVGGAKTASTIRELASGRIIRAGG